jgi:hypothetical protein
VQRIVDLLTKGKALWINHDNAQRRQPITNGPGPLYARYLLSHKADFAFGLSRCPVLWKQADIRPSVIRALCASLAAIPGAASAISKS